MGNVEKSVKLVHWVECQKGNKYEWEVGEGVVWDLQRQWAGWGCNKLQLLDCLLMGVVWDC